MWLDLQELLWMPQLFWMRQLLRMRRMEVGRAATRPPKFDFQTDENRCITQIMQA